MSLHRPNASILEEQPIVHFIPLPRALGEADLVLGVVALYEVLHDASGFEEVVGLAVGEGVRQRGDTSVGIDRAEPRLFLGVFADFDFVGLVGNAAGG